MEELFKKYGKILKTEALIKSLVFGGILGLFVWGVISIIGLIIDVNTIIIGLISFILICGATTVLLLKFKFIVNKAQIAKRIDSLGMQERAITMLEFENIDNSMVKLQKENATETILKLPKEKFKMNFKMIYIYILCGVFLFATSFSVATGVNASIVNAEIEKDIVDNFEFDGETSINTDKLIEGLRELINNSNTAYVDSDLKVQVHQIVDNLEIDLYYLKTDEEKLAEILKATELIKKLLEEAFEEFDDLLIMGYSTRYILYIDSTIVYLNDLGKALYTEDADTAIVEMNEAFKSIKAHISSFSGDDLIEVLRLYADELYYAVGASIVTDEVLVECLEYMADGFVDVIISLGGTYDKIEHELKGSGKVSLNYGSLAMARAVNNFTGEGLEDFDTWFENYLAENSLEAGSVSKEDRENLLDEYLEDTYTLASDSSDKENLALDDLFTTLDKSLDVLETLAGKPSVEEEFEDLLEDLEDLVVDEILPEDSNEESEDEDDSSDDTSGGFIVDGETYYGDIYEISRDDAYALIYSGQLSEEQANILAKYFNILLPATN